MSPLWIIRILFLMLLHDGRLRRQPGAAGIRRTGIQPASGHGPLASGFGGLMIAVDELVKGFSLRAFSSITFGLLLGTVVALLIDHSGLSTMPMKKSAGLSVSACS